MTTATDGRAGVRLQGDPVPGGALSLEEIVRPFAVADRGVTFIASAESRAFPYRELAGMAAAVAARLRRSGVRRADRVAMTIGNDLNSVLAVMGIWAAGATVVSVPVAPRRTASLHTRHVGALLRAAQCEFLLSADTEDIAAEVGQGGEGRPRIVPLMELCRGVSAETETRREVDLDGTALIQFTSGSVSAPKGVAIGTARLAGHMHVLKHELGFDEHRDRVVSWLPLCHDFGLLAMFLSSLAARIDLVLMTPSTFAFGPSRWLATVARTRGTITAAPNFAYRMAATVPYDGDLDLSSLRLSLSGGERLSWQTLVDFHRATEPFGLRWDALTPSYGLAESVVGSTKTPLGRGPVRGPGDHVSVGRPLSGLRLEAPDGLPAGPIRLAGDWVFDGYHTVDGFVATPAGDWFDTGDHGFVHDGELYVLGRRDEVVHAAGRNIFAEDVETAVYDAGGVGVKACAAFRLNDTDQQFGLMIEIPARPRRSPDTLAVQMRAAVSSALGVRVHTVLVVRPGTIPRTTSGKVRRARCRELHARGELRHRLLITVS